MIRRSSHDKRRGAALLEAIVALAVLAAMASSSVWMSAEATRAVDRAYAKERAIRGAANLLSAVSLWPLEDLNRHLGRTQQGPWLLDVERPKTGLYRAMVVDRATDQALLETTLYRPHGVE